MTKERVILHIGPAEKGQGYVVRLLGEDEVVMYQQWFPTPIDALADPAISPRLTGDQKAVAMAKLTGSHNFELEL